MSLKVDLNRGLLVCILHVVVDGARAWAFADLSIGLYISISSA